MCQATEESQEAVGAAVSAGEACVEAISKHGQLVVSVLETEEPVAPLEAAAAAGSSGSTAAWQDVIEAAAAKSEALKEAQVRNMFPSCQLITRGVKALFYEFAGDSCELPL